MKKNLLHRFFISLVILTGFFMSGFGQVSGDYRSFVTGNWDAIASWETYDGANWAAASVKPAATNSVYIQSGHTITLSADESCNDLHFCNNTTSATTGTVRGKVDVAAFTLEVNGKLRSYWGAVGVIPGTTLSTVTNSPYASNGGKIKFVGNTRIITNTGEWASTANSPSATNCDIEIALNPGEAGTFQTNIKAGHWTFTSGTMNILTVAADKSTTLANITIGPNATVIAGSINNTFQKSGSGLAGALTVDGKLIFTAATPKIQVTSIAFNGTVQYDLAGDQTLAVAGTGAGAALPNTYNTLIISNSGVKTLGLNTTVNTSFIKTGTASLNLGAFTFTDKSANDITSFDILSQISSVIDVNNHTVTVTMPSGVALSALTPTITVSAGASIAPLSGVEQNFSSPVNYTVTAENLLTQIYVVTVVNAPASTATDILSFNFTTPAVTGTVDAGNHTVALTVPYGTLVSALVPTITLSAGATVSPLSGVAANFTSPASYTVTAEDGTTTQLWTVSVSVTPNTETDITSFSFSSPSVTGAINAISHTVDLSVPYGTNLTNLVSTFTLSSGATMKIGTTNQVSGTTPNNFTSPLIYTVTADDGVTTQAWTATVAVASATETDITSFSFSSPAASGVINTTNHTVSITVPYGTNVTSLAPVIVVSGGATISPLSGVAQNFTSPVQYTVTAQDAITSQQWTVTVIIAANTATDILTFNFSAPAAVGTVNTVNHTVALTVPYGTNVTALVPAITLSAGATISPLSGVAKNFTSPVTYSVTAQDGATNQAWVVTVTIAPNTETKILTFNFTSPAAVGTVNVANHTVALTVPYGTSVTALVPTITLSPGASVSPLSGAAANFTSAVTYTVKAEDGITTQAWIATVTIAANTATDILTFNFTAPSVVGTVDAVNHTAALTVPFGTDVTALVPAITVSGGATVSPLSGVAANYTSPVTYTVKAQDGTTTQAWIITVTIAPDTAGEPLAYDPFDYESGQLLSAQVNQGWAPYSTGGISEVLVSSGNLVYPGLLPSKGNKASLDGAGTDISRSFPSQNTVGAKVYYSFILQVDSMLNVTASTGSHFAGFSQATSTVGASVYFKWDGVEGSNKFNLGLAVRGATASTPVYSVTTYDINSPIFVVGCYELIDGLLNDKSYMWINPTPDEFGLSSPPSALLSADGGAATDLTSLGYFYIRQDAATLTPYMNIDELRIGLTWADVTPKAGVVSFSPEENSVDVDISVTPTITYIKPIQKIGGAAISDSDLAGLITLKKNNASGASVPFTASINDNKQVITITPSSVLDFSSTYYIAVASVQDNTGAAISGKNSKFTTRVANDNAVLTDLKVDGSTVAGFDASTLSYNITLDYGTTIVPSISYVLSDNKASAAITNAPAVPGTSSVVVTAENGTTKTTYSIIFSVSSTASSDATLSDMQTGGVTIEGFASSIYEYLVALPFGTVVPPVVTVTTSSPVANAVVTQAQSMTDITFIEVTAQDGSTMLTYAILFEIDAYIYKVGFTKVGAGNDEVPFDGWTTNNTIVSSNWGTLPIVNHGEFDGPEAFRFIAGKSASGSTPGWLKTSKYPKTGALRFWLYVQASDGNEALLIHKKVKDADSVLIATLSSAEMTSTNWKEFSFDINQSDSTAIIFTSVLATDVATRIWIDDLSLRGKITTGIYNYNAQNPMVSLFPNPVHDQLTIDMNHAEYEVLDIYNSMGSKIMSKKIIDSNFDLNVRDLKDGIYFIQFKGKNILYTMKFIKQ